MDNQNKFTKEHAVIFVDDEPSVLSAIKRDLAEEKHHFLFTTNPSEALSLIEVHRPAVLVSDLSMPGMNGIELIEKASALNREMICMILSAHAEVANVMEAINIGHVWRYITKPWEANELILAIRNAIDLFEIGLRSRYECYYALAELAEIRDTVTGVHLMRIGTYTNLLAEKLGRNKQYCREIAVLSALHDIGKVGIPDEILLSKVKLTPTEFNIMKRHTLLGYQILKDKPAFKMGAEIAYSHHERYDGSGYPQGLHGNDIPISSRIVALADVYDALRQWRHYKEAWDHHQAMDYIVKNSGFHFDPDVVNSFVAIADQFAEIAKNQPHKNPKTRETAHV